MVRDLFDNIDNKFIIISLSFDDFRTLNRIKDNCSLHLR